MFILPLIFAACLLIAGLTYLVSRFRKFALLRRVSGESRALSWLLALLPVAFIGLFWYLIFNITTAVVVLLHLMLFFALCDLAAFLIRKVRKKKPEHYYAGAAALVLTALYLGVGWVCAHHVFVTAYTLETSKDLGQDSLRIVEIADAHLGITLDGEGFARELARVEALEPDLVVLVGDFVDDDSSKEDMLAAARALGEMEIPVYFVYGNHDEGYFRYRNFTAQELETALCENGVTILRDEAALINDCFYLIGRLDRSFPGREEASALMEGLDSDKFMILLDHQPNDYKNEAEAAPDLVLSGHTHGGHIFPAGQLGLLMGANDRIYGAERRGDTVFIVTSGISGWAIPFKTGTFSEIVVVDITMK